MYVLPNTNSLRSLLYSLLDKVASSRHMLKRWQAPTRFLVQSTFRRFKMTLSSSGTLSNPSLRLVRSKSTISRLSIMGCSICCTSLLTAACTGVPGSHCPSSQFFMLAYLYHLQGRVPPHQEKKKRVHKLHNTT